MFPNIIGIKREIFDYDNDAENNECHKDGIRKNIECVKKKFNGSGVILKLYGHSFKHLRKDFIELERVLMPEVSCQFKIGVR
jgi:hypothetical protein